MDIQSLHELYDDQIRYTGDVIEAKEIAKNPITNEFCVEAEHNLTTIIQAIEQHPLHSLQAQRTYTKEKLKEYTFSITPPCTACQYDSTVSVVTLDICCRSCNFDHDEFSRILTNIDTLEGVLDMILINLESQGLSELILIVGLRQVLDSMQIGDYANNRLYAYLRNRLADLAPDSLLTDEAAFNKYLDKAYSRKPLEDSNLKGPTNKYEKIDAENPLTSFCLMGREKDYKIGGFTCPYAPAPQKIDDIRVYFKSNINACNLILEEIDTLEQQ